METRWLMMPCDDVMWWCNVSSDPRISDPPSFSSFPAHSEVNQFSLSSKRTFGRPHVIPMPLLPDSVLPMTSDLQVRGQMVDQGNFIHPAGLPNGIQDLNSLPHSAASAPAGPDLMEASSMGGIENPGDPQNHQPCKYDLLSSVPRECALRLLTRNLLHLTSLLVLVMSSWVKKVGPDPNRV